MTRSLFVSNSHLSHRSAASSASMGSNGGVDRVKFETGVEVSRPGEGITRIEYREREAGE